jgi:hypothetical protein
VLIELLVHPNPHFEPYRPASPLSPSLENELIGGATVSPHVPRSSSASSVGQLIYSITDHTALPLGRQTSPPAVPIISPILVSSPDNAAAPRDPPTITLLSAPGSLLSAPGANTAFPRVVVVNPTPHPTPPATPLVGPVSRAVSERPVSPVPALPPAIAGAESRPPAAGEAVLPPTKVPVERPTPAPLAQTRPADHDPHFFLPPVSPLDNSGSSGDTSSVLALIATPEPRPASLPPIDEPERPERRPEPTREHSSDPHLGTSVVSQSSVVSRSSAGVDRKGHAAGKRPAGAGAKAVARRPHGAHARPGLARKHSTGANTGKTSLAAGALRRSSSTASGVAETSILRALTAMPEKPKRRPPPVLTDAPAPESGPLSALTSAKSPKKSKAAQAALPSPLFKARGGTRSKAGHAKGKRPVMSRSKSSTRPREDSEGATTEEDVGAADPGVGDDDDEGWNDYTKEELAAQAAAEREAALEREREADRQRHREFFRKRPKSEYEHLARTQSTGLLTQLLNPDPRIFPPEHPYRRQFSTDDLARLGPQRPHQSALSSQLAPMTALRPPTRQVQTGFAPPTSTVAAPAHAAPGPSCKTPAISRTSSLAALGGANPALKFTKSAVALPTTDSVTIGAQNQPAMVGTSAIAAVTKAKANIGLERPSLLRPSASTTQVRAPAPPQTTGGPRGSPSSGGYRPRGVPTGVELETDTEDEDDASIDNGIQVARSVAQQRLAALGRRSTPKAPAPSPSSSHAHPPAPPNAALLKQLPTKPPRPRSEQQVAGHVPPASSRALESTASASTLVEGTAPIALVYPYNLPITAAAPRPAHVQRQVIVQTELSESLRRELLKEHKVNRAAPPRRQGVLGAGGALRPLTTLGRERTAEEEADHRRREQRAAHTREHADNFHAHGW